MTPAPSSQHQFAVGELFLHLRLFFGGKNCLVFTAPFDVYFSEDGNYEHPDDITQPDITVVCNRNKITHKGCFGAPEIIVEVLSPATAVKDYNEKFDIYQKYGVKEYWIVDTANRMVHVYPLQDGTYNKRLTYGEQDELRSALFPNLTIALEAIFALESSEK